MALATGAASPPPPAAPLFVAFHDGWDPAAVRELPRRLGAMDVFAPRWITVRGAAAQVVVEPDDGVPQMTATMRRPPKVFPIVSNAHDDIWDLPAAQAVILDRAAQAAFAARLAQLARANGYAGYVMDFENLSPQAQAAYPALLAALRRALAPAGREVWVTAGVSADLPGLAAAADAVVVMAYDECWANATPGPVAGQDWLAAVMAQRMPQLDPRKVILALASYGYDWPARSPAKAIGAPAAMALAARTGSRPVRDQASGNLHFSYTPRSGPRHDVWLIDAQAFAMQARIGAAWGVRGLALWRLGMEDPAIWSLPRASAAGAHKPAVRPDAPLPHPCDPLPPR
jgi:spore germination protein YaaH